jgi:hypothetical protein
MGLTITLTSLQVHLQMKCVSFLESAMNPHLLLLIQALHMFTILLSQLSLLVSPQLILQLLLKLPQGHPLNILTTASHLSLLVSPQLISQPLLRLAQEPLQ